MKQAYKKLPILEYQEFIGLSDQLADAIHAHQAQGMLLQQRWNELRELALIIQDHYGPSHEMNHEAQKRLWDLYDVRRLSHWLKRKDKAA